MVVAAAAAALLPGCSTVAGIAGGAVPGVRASDGLSVHTLAVRREADFALVDGHGGVRVLWAPKPDGSWLVSLSTVPLDTRSAGRSDTFRAEGPGPEHPGARVYLTWVSSWPRNVPAGSGELRLAEDGRSLVLSVSGWPTVALTRMTEGQFEVAMLRARMAASAGSTPAR
ncbi:hypothetical protein [Oryzihumus leptocrescens]|uniref:hypothetical protein n=1 Tax=Oryzihumus leptocrescens TaxID=297536 RepID=UPI0011523313|nr:hypothetical protein [Oryzihumus leptocrescens]